MADIAELGFKLDTRDLARGKTELDGLARSAKQAEDAAGSMSKGADKASGSTKELAKSSRSAADEAEKLARSQSEAAKQAGNLAGGLGALAVGFAGLTIARAATDSIAQFSKEVAYLKATLGGTADQMAELRDQAKQIGSATSFSLAEVAKAQRVLAQAGLDAQSVLKATTDVLKFAQAGDFKDLENAAEMLVDVAGQTGKTAKDFASLGDVMVATADASTTSVQQLGFSYKYSAGIAKDLGTSFEQVSAAMALLAVNGIKGESAGTGLRSVMASLINPSKENEKVWAALGFTLDDLNPNMSSLADVLQKIGSKNVSIENLFQLFGNEGASVANTLTQKYAQLDGYLKQIGDSAGITAKKAETMSDNLSTAFSGVASAADAAAVQISDSLGFEEAAKAAANSLSGIISSFAGLNEAAVASGAMSRQAAEDYKTFEAAATALAGAVGGAGLAYAISLIPAPAALAAISVGALDTAMTALAVTIMAHPLGALVTILGATAGWLYANRDAVVEFGNTGATIGERVRSVFESLRQTAYGLWDAMAGLASLDMSRVAASFDQVKSPINNVKAAQGLNTELARMTGNAKAYGAAVSAIKEPPKAPVRPIGRTDAPSAGRKGGAGSADKEARALATEQAKLNDLLQKGEGFSASYAESLALLAKYQNRLPVDQYRTAVERLILTQTDVGKAATKAAEDRAREIAALDESADKIERETELYGLSALQIAELNAAKTEAALIDARESGAIDAVIESLSQELIARNKIIEATRKQETKRISADAAKQAADDWKESSKDIERALTDALMRGFDEGKSFGDSLVDYLKNAFESTAIKIVLQPVMSAINSIGQPLSDGIASGDLIGAAKGAWAGLQSGGDAFSGSIESALKSGFGQNLGLSTPATYSIGPNIGSGIDAALIRTEPQLTALGEGAKVAGEALAYLPAVMSAAEGKWGASSGAALGTYLTAGNPLGGMIGQQLGSMVDDFFGGGGPDQRTAKFGSGASSALTAEGMATGWTGSSVFGEFRTYADKWFSDSEMRPAMSAFIDTLETLDSAVATTLTVSADQAASVKDALSKIDTEYNFGEQWTDFTTSSKAREQIAVDRYATILDGIDKGWGDFVRSFAGTFDQFPEFIGSLMQSMAQFRDGALGLEEVFKQQITSISQFSALAKGSETAAQAFSRLNTVFAATNGALQAIGHSSEGLDLRTSALRESFVAAAGGVDSMSSIVATFIDSTYTESEKLALKTQGLTDRFASLGVVMPSNTQALRDLVKAQDLSTAAGQRLALQLMQLSPALADVTAAAAVDVEALRSDVSRAYENESNALRTTIDRLQQFAIEVRKFRDSLYLDQELSPLSIFDRYTLSGKMLEELQIRALAGDEDARAQLEQSATDFLNYSRQYNANNAQYLSDFDRVQAILRGAESSAIQQISNAERQLSALDKMVAGILDVNKSLLTLADAVAAFAAGQQAIKEPVAGGAVTISGGIASSSATGQSATVGAIQDSIGQNVASGNFGAIYSAAAANGFTADQLASVSGISGVTGSSISDWIASQGLPALPTVNGSHANGLDYVPFDGYVAELHKGERVLTATESRSFGDGSSDSAVVFELQALRQEMAKLQTQLSQAHGQNLQQRAAIAEVQIKTTNRQTIEMQRVAAAGV